MSCFSDDGPYKKQKIGYTVPKEFIEEMQHAGAHDDPLIQKSRKIADREDEYQKRKYLRVISPPRHDPLKNIDKTPDVNSRTFADIMSEQQLENERQEMGRRIAKQKDMQKKRIVELKNDSKPSEKFSEISMSKKSMSTAASTKSDWEKAEKASAFSASKWDTPNRVEETPGRRNRWDVPTPSGDTDATLGRRHFGETPTPGRWADPTPSRFGETPNPKRSSRSRWDDKTPLAGRMTPSIGFTPTPGGLLTPSSELGTALTPDKIQTLRLEREIDERNRPLTDEELNLLPIQGYEIVKPPEGYQPLRAAGRKNVGASVAMPQTPSYYQMPDQQGKPYEVPGTPSQGPGAMPHIKPDDLGYFGALLNQVNEEELSVEDQKERKIMMLLLKSRMVLLQ